MTGRHIVAIGGAGFEEDSAPLIGRALELSGRERPRVCFLPTASGDSAEYVVRFYERFARSACAPSHLALFGAPDPAAVREAILGADVVYVGGGNPANMLAVWRLHGVDVLLHEAWEHGTVLAGTSAGANCWFEACTTDSFGPIAPLHDGLGFLPGSFCPHYDAEPERRPVYLGLVGDGFPVGYAAEDGVALRFDGTELVEVVSGKANGRAYRVELVGGEVREMALPPGPMR